MIKEKKLETKLHFDRICNEICTIVESYYIWKTLVFSRSVPEVGKELASENALIINSYLDFFIPTEHSHQKTFIIGLVKLFDKNSSTLSIAGLIKEIKKNNSIFINQNTINYIEKFLKEHIIIINGLKDIRDKQFAHTDKKIIKGEFIPNNVEILIDGVQEIFNKLSIDFDGSGTMFSHLKNNSIGQTNFLLEVLRKLEKQRREKKQYDKLELTT